MRIVMKRVVILQSNYIPWKGYFELIKKTDLFIFYDDVQYTKYDWRNRNKILTPSGPLWLSIPCGINEKRLICEVRIDCVSWQKEHWATIERNYRESRYWDYYSPYLEEFYLQNVWKHLSELNQAFIKDTCDKFLGIKTEFSDSREYSLKYSKGERIMELLKQVGATHYLSGPAAKSYLKEESFVKENIDLEWMDYSGYPEYEQLYPPFTHNVSIIDLIFACGPDAPAYIWGPHPTAGQR